MRELRLIGVHEDGEHLLLTEDGEDRLTLPVDDALRSALRPAPPRQPRPSTDVESVDVPDELRPRDVQALLRAGVSVEDVAERAGWSVEKVTRYEGPIRAERDHLATTARNLAVDAELTFGERVEQRLDARGVAEDDIIWDAWRGHEGEWSVICSFPAGGRQRQASWHFDPRGRTLEAADDEARWLGEDETSQGPLSAGTPLEASVYDVEAEGGLDGSPTPVRRVRGGRTSATAVPAAVEPAERPVDLVAAMRERSKNRRRKGRPAPMHDFPEDAAPREKLDTSGAAPPVGSHPREEELAEDAHDGPTVDDLGEDPVTGTADLFAELPEDSEGAALDAQDAAEDSDDSVDSSGVSDDVSADADSPGGESVSESEEASAGDSGDTDDRPSDEDESPTDTTDSAEKRQNKPVKGKQDHKDRKPRKARKPVSVAPEPAASVPDRPSSARKGRPSVPSWDDIMFGRRPGRD